MKKSLLLFLCMLWAAGSFAAPGENILGVWNNEEKDAKIRIFKCKDKYCGKIIAIREALNPSASTEAAPRLDENNPDSAKRARRLMGLSILDGFVFAGSNEWKGGTLYDLKEGKTYKGKMVLIAPNKLVMRGYIGSSLFGKNTTWTRDRAKR